MPCRVKVSPDSPANSEKPTPSQSGAQKATSTLEPSFAYFLQASYEASSLIPLPIWLPGKSRSAESKTLRHSRGRRQDLKT